MYSSAFNNGNVYNLPGYMNSSDYAVLEQYQHKPRNRKYEIATGSSVIGMIYNDGVIIAADSLVSMGDNTVFQSITRVHVLNNKTILGFSGDYADCLEVKDKIKRKLDNAEIRNDNNTSEDDHTINPKYVYDYLTGSTYSSWMKTKCTYAPQYEIVVGGYEDSEPFLGVVSFNGFAYRDRYVATGIGRKIALPILRKCSEGTFSGPLEDKESAIEKIKKCMNILFYRDTHAYSKYIYAICFKEAKPLQEVKEVEENWDHAKLIGGYEYTSSGE